MLRFSDLSIRWQLVLSMGALVATVVFAGVVSVIYIQQQDNREALIARGEALSQALSQDFVKIMIMGSANLSSDTVNKLRAFPVLNQLVLQTPMGELQLSYTKDDVGSVELTKSLPVHHKLTIRDKHYGDIHLLLDQTDLITKRDQIIWLAIALFPVMLLLTLIITWALQRNITVPLVKLANTITKSARDSNFSERLEVKDNSEIGRLIYGYNHLLDRVEESNFKLQQQAERIQVTLASIADGVITTDVQGKIEYLNSAAENMTGWLDKQAHGRPIQEIFSVIKKTVTDDKSDPVSYCLENHTTVYSDENCEVKTYKGTILAVDFTVSEILNPEDESTRGAVLVFSDVSHNREMSRQLNYQATHDHLTGLLNRKAFEEKLKLSHEKAVENDQLNVLMYMDLDQFKVVNDTSGHAAGDKLLCEIAQLLQTKVRMGDCLARLGGDEFGLILANCPLQRAELLADEIRYMISDYRCEWEGQLYSVGISIGIAVIDKEVSDIKLLLGNADAACYQAKEKGRNTSAIYVGSDEAVQQRRIEMTMVARIREALDYDNFELYCQPIVPIGSFKDKGAHYEVLLRMNDNGTVLAPGSFLPSAERYGLIKDIDVWVFKRLIKMLKQQPEHVLQLSLCSFNLSGDSMRAPEVRALIEKELIKYPQLAARICIEITETIAIGNLDEAIKFIERVKVTGASFALDDFGTGMSSLEYLKQLPVDLVKIDGCFVRDILHDPIDHAMVQAIKSIASLTGKRTVAEFVENEHVLRKLKECGIDYAQGYFFSKPVPLQQAMTAKLNIA